MLTFKEKVLIKIEEAETTLTDFIDVLNQVLYRVRKAKEMVNDIRVEPTRIGIPKPATTIEDLQKINQEIYPLRISFDRLADKAYVSLTLLKDEVNRESIRLQKEQENTKKIKAGNVYKSEEGSTIVEVEKVKLED